MLLKIFLYWIFVTEGNCKKMEASSEFSTIEFNLILSEFRMGLTSFLFIDIDPNFYIIF